MIITNANNYNAIAAKLVNMATSKVIKQVLAQRNITYGRKYTRKCKVEMSTVKFWMLSGPAHDAAMQAAIVAQLAEHKISAYFTNAAGMYGPILSLIAEIEDEFEADIL